MVFRLVQDQIMTLCYWSEIQKSWKNLKSMILLWFQWNLVSMNLFVMRMVFRPVEDQIMTFCYWSEILKSWKNLKSMILLRFQWNLVWISLLGMRNYLDGFKTNTRSYNDTLLLEWNPKTMKKSKIYDFAPISMKFGMDKSFCHAWLSRWFLDQ